MKFKVTRYAFTIFTAVMLTCTSALAAPKEGKGPKSDPPQENANYVVYGDFPSISNSVDPDADIMMHGLSSQGQMVFYDVMMDTRVFTGTLSDGETLCDHGFKDGILVIEPKSNNNPVVARGLFWFNGTLEDLSTTTHLIEFEGVFNDPQNWPPSESDKVTTVTFDDWAFHAENRKAQRMDCAGEIANYPDPIYTFTVERQ